MVPTAITLDPTGCRCCCCLEEMMAQLWSPYLLSRRSVLLLPLSTLCTHTLECLHSGFALPSTCPALEKGKGTVHPTAAQTPLALLGSRFVLASPDGVITLVEPETAYFKS